MRVYFPKKSNKMMIRTRLRLIFTSHIWYYVQIKEAAHSSTAVRAAFYGGTQRVKMNITPKIRVFSCISGGEETEKIEVTADAAINGTENDYTIEYSENLFPEVKTTTTIRVINGSAVSVIRSGDIANEITAEPGKRHLCHYLTPYGEIVFGVYGHRVNSTVSETGGTLEIEYEINYPDGASTAHSMIIDII